MGLRRREPSALAGACLGALAVLALAALIIPVRDEVSRATPTVALVLPVVVAGIAGGRAASLLTAIIAATALNLAFIPPLWTLKVNSVDDGVALAVFAAVALVVGTLVAWERDRRRAAERRSEEIEALHRQYEVVVAERERLMEESHQLALLRGIDEQRQALLRSVSHDLRTPLASIRAVTSDMRSGVAYDDTTRDDLLELVGDEVERLDRLVANLLSLSRIEAGALQPDRQAVALDELASDCVRRLTRSVRTVRLTSSVSADIPLVDADYSQLDQVLSNLLENAARHSPERGEVAVRARSLGDEVEVSVTDQGPGVDMSKREELFQAFRTGPGSQSSGIGLAICRAIVEAHGGHLDARNGTDGGAVFTFTMPVRHA
ncbi:MAG: sensor histidine kinase [Acidimicrobiales bacterium]